MDERLKLIEAKIEKARKNGKNKIELAVFRGEIMPLLRKGYMLAKENNKTVIYFDSVLRD